MENPTRQLLNHLLDFVNGESQNGVSRVRPPEDIERELSRLSGMAPRGVEGLDKALRFYQTHAVKTSDPFFMNQLWAGLSESGVLAEYLGAAMNTSMYTYEVAPVATMIELAAIDLLRERLGFSQADGTFVPGASYGNMLGLLLARHKAFPDMKTDGQSRSLVLFVSEDSHYSFLKAANILGIGESNVVKVKVDSRGRMCPQALKDAVVQSRAQGKTPFVVGVTAGTTVRAAFDPIDAIADICESENLWLHLDAALGGSVLFSETHRERLLRGSQRADSVIMNMHKMMGVPIHCSAFLCRHLGDLNRATTLKATDTDYLFHEDDAIDLGHFSLQCGRKADALKFWLAWVQEGLDGFEERVDKVFQLARYSQKKIEQSETLAMLGGDVESVTVCFHFRHFSDERDDSLNRDIRDQLMAEGSLAINYGGVHGRLALRIVPFNSRLEESHIDEILKKIQDKGAEILRREELRTVCEKESAGELR